MRSMRRPVVGLLGAPVEDDAWKAPEEPGIYTCSITADWPERGAGCAVLVEVR